MSIAKTAEFLLMGCSVSSGVPAIGNDWGNCDPNEPKNLRQRPCAVVRTDDTTLIIDTGPDFRDQMNRHNIANLDGVIYTHAHSDHVGGIDELRIIKFRQDAYINVYSNQQTLEILESRYDYMFHDIGGYKKTIISNELPINKPTVIGDINFTAFEQDHGDEMRSLGFRFGDLGYSVDMRFIDEKGLNILKGIDTWVVDGAGHHVKDHPTHAPLNRVIEMNKIVQARQVYVIGLSKFMDYKTINDALPDGFECGYDDLTIDISF